MSPDEAERVLIQSTQEENGVFMLLRLGVHPSLDEIHSLRKALRVLWRYSKEMDSIPRRIAFRMWHNCSFWK